MSSADKFIAVGDVHGCLPQLEEILIASQKYPDHKLVFLGDYIDRGPDSDGVCRLLSQTPGIYLMGNHEEVLLTRLDREPEHQEQILSIANVSLPSLNWIKTSLVDSFFTEKYIFVHAGLDPHKKMEEQTTRDFFWTIWHLDYSQLTQKIVVHGHAIVDKPEVMGNRINLNTGCGNGGRLTAIVLPEMEFISSSPSAGKAQSWDYIRKELESELEEIEEDGESWPSTEWKDWNTQ